MFNAYAQTRYVAPAWSAYCHYLGEEGLTHVANQILSAYSRTPSSFQLFSRIYHHLSIEANYSWQHTFTSRHLTNGDSFLVYLAHVLEHIVWLVMIFVGMSCGCGRVKTLIDASVGNCKGNISAFQLSIMIGLGEHYCAGHGMTILRDVCHPSTFS